MEYVVYFIGLVMIFIGIWQIYKIRKSGDITEQGWAEVRMIGYRTIDRLLKLQAVKTDKDLLSEYIVTEIKNEIDAAEALTEQDRNFWTAERLTAIFKPAILGLIDQADSLKK